MKVRWLPLAFCALALLAMTPLAFFALIGAVVLAALYLPIKQRSISVRLALASGLLYSFIAIVGAAFWVGHLPDMLFWCLPLSIGLIGACLGKVKPQPPARLKFDPIGLLLAAAIGLTLFAPYIHTPTFATLLQVFAYKGDNSSHLDLVTANVLHKGYVYYSYEDLRQYAYPTLSGYPQGWHLNVAVVQKSLDSILPITGHPSRQIALFYGLAVTQFVAVALLAYEAILLLWKRLRPNNNRLQNIAAKLVAATAVASLFLGSFTTLFAYGFQTQIAALWLTLVILICLIYQPRLTAEVTDRRFFMWAAVCFVGLAMTWQVSAVPLALVFLIAFFHKKMLPWRLPALLKEWRFVVLLALLAAASLFQFYILFHFGNQQTTIYQPGLTPEPPEIALLALLAMAAVSLFVYKKMAPKDGAVFTLALFAGTAALFSAILYAAIVLKTGKPSYYYYKTTFGFILLAAILTAPLVIQIVSLAIAKSASRLVHGVVIITLIVASCTVPALGASLETKTYLDGTLSGLDPTLANELAAQLDKSPRPKVIVIGSCIPDQDYKASAIAQTLAADPEIKQIKVRNPFEKMPPYVNGVYAFVRARPQQNTAVISFDRSITERLRQEFDGNPKVAIIDKAASAQPKNKAQCPNFIGFE